MEVRIEVEVGEGCGMTTRTELYTLGKVYTWGKRDSGGQGGIFPPRMAVPRYLLMSLATLRG